MRSVLLPSLFAFLSSLTPSVSRAEVELRAAPIRTAFDACALRGPGHRDDRLDPGERLEFYLGPFNSGSTAAHDVAVQLSTSSPAVTIRQGRGRSFLARPGERGLDTPRMEIEVDGSVPCGTSLPFEVTFRTRTGSWTDEFTFDIPGDCNPCVQGAAPAVAALERSEDWCVTGGPGDGDGHADPGELVTARLTFINPGDQDVTGVVATVTSINEAERGFPGISGTAASSLPDVWITDGEVRVGTVGPRQAVRPDDTVELRLDPKSLRCGGQVPLYVLVESDRGNRLDTLTLSVPESCQPCAPAPSLAIHEVLGDHDRCPHGGPGELDFALDPGESQALRFRLVNRGTADARDVRVTVTSRSPAVRLAKSVIERSVVPAGRITRLLFDDVELELVQPLPCGTPLTFDVSLLAAEGSWSDTFTMNVADPCTPCVAGPHPPLRDALVKYSGPPDWGGRDAMTFRVAETGEVHRISRPGGVIRLAGDPDRLVRINDAWLPAVPGEITWLHATACCAVAFGDPGYHADDESICGRLSEPWYGSPACPPLTEAVVPGRAHDEKCPPEHFGRCVLIPQVRAVRVSKLAPGTSLLVGGERIPIADRAEDAQYVPISRGPSRMPRASLLVPKVSEEDAPTASLALTTGHRYTVQLDPTGVVAVLLDGRVAPPGHLPAP